MALRLRKKKDERSTSELQSVLQASELPTFPIVVIRTLEALRDPDSSAADVAAALSVDPGLTVELLKLVNSAGYSPSRPVTSVDQAVAVAGFGAIESMVLSVGVGRVMPRGEIEGMDHSRFWQAAGRRATTARAFAVELHPATISLSFTAGLLQDMAVPFLAANRPDYAPLLQAWNDEGEDLHALEQSAFGWNHATLGEALCIEWGLPESLAEAIGGHHDRDQARSPVAVQLASPLREIEMASVTEAIVARATEEFGLEADRVVAIIEQAEADAVEVANLFL